MKGDIQTLLLVVVFKKPKNNIKNACKTNLFAKIGQIAIYLSFKIKLSDFYFRNTRLVDPKAKKTLKFSYSEKKI